MSDVAIRDSGTVAVPAQQDELSVGQLVGQVQKIQQAMQLAMKEGEHFGVIPGTDKPTLLKPGAEKLALLFRLDPEYEPTERFEPSGHYTVSVRCTLYHIPTGNRVASGFGMCSSRETKYAFRTASRKCPSCGVEAIIKGRPEYGGGWVCFKKKGGCGDKFLEDENAIVNQQTGRVDNENLADTYNTVLKMACKRALVAAVLNGTAASDIFTQDLEDIVDEPPVAPVVDEDVRPAKLRKLFAVADKLNKEQSPIPAEVDAEDWKDYVKVVARERYNAQSRSDLSVEQLDELTEHLSKMSVPFS